MKRSRTKSKSTRHSYDIESGTREALAYDSLKSVNSENDYNKFASTEMMLYRITSSLATLCAGLTLWLGYKRAYEIDIFFGLIAMGFAFGLKEISVDDNEHSQYSISQKLKEVITESINFLVTNKKSQSNYVFKCTDRRRINTCGKHYVIHRHLHLTADFCISQDKR